MRINNIELSNNLFLSPMAGYTDLAFRLLAKRHGVGMVFTEMVSGHGLVSSNKKTEKYLLTTPEEYPLSVQIFGSEPDCLAEAAGLIQERGVAAIDVNMGCPVRKVVKSGAGAGLMKDIYLSRKIIKAIRKAVSIPLTVKLRSGWDSQSINCHKMALMAEDYGADAIIIHPRTAQQFLNGRAEWKIIRELKEMVNIPVIGNGDIKTYRDVFKMEAMTGCDGVMIGRGALGNPWIFQDANDYRRMGIYHLSRTPQSKLATIISHLHLIEDIFDEKVGLNRFKAHVSHYLKGIPGVKSLRHHLYTEVNTFFKMELGIKKFFNSLTYDDPYSGGNGLIT